MAIHLQLFAQNQHELSVKEAVSLALKQVNEIKNLKRGEKLVGENTIIGCGLLYSRGVPESHVQTG